MGGCTWCGQQSRLGWLEAAQATMGSFLCSAWRPRGAPAHPRGPSSARGVGFSHLLGLADPDPGASRSVSPNQSLFSRGGGHEITETQWEPAWGVWGPSPAVCQSPVCPETWESPLPRPEAPAPQSGSFILQSLGPQVSTDPFGLWSLPWVGHTCLDGQTWPGRSPQTAQGTSVCSGLLGSSLEQPLAGLHPTFPRERPAPGLIRKSD